MSQSRCAIAAAFLIVCLLIASCQLGAKLPSIEASLAQAGGVQVLRVTGRNWQPGDRVDVGLALPSAQPTDSEAVSSALVDAGGGFVAIVQLPADTRWGQVPRFSVVAHTPDFGQVATYLLEQAPATGVGPTPGLPASPTAPAASYVLGYAENVVPEARTIKIRPVEGVATTLVLNADAAIVRQGQPVGLADIVLDDLLEATGRLDPGDPRRMLVSQLRVLTPPAPLETASATLAPTPSMPLVSWKGEYYNNTTFSGQPWATRDDPVIDFQWQGGPALEGMPTDNFAIRWSGVWPFERGVYRIHAQVDDGVRVWVDGHLIIDQWYQSSGALYEADAYVSEGQHTVRVDYLEAQGNAYARIWWDYRGPDAVQAFMNWKGEYYSNAFLAGLPYLVVSERQLDFDWGQGSAAPGMPADGFSARWTQALVLDEGLYRFYARSDDGVRLWVDDVQLIDEWYDHAASTVASDVSLAGGQHAVHVEYYENTGNAMIRVWWELLLTTPTPSPSPTPAATETPELIPTETSVPTATASPTEQQTPENTQPAPDVTPMSPGGTSFHVYFPQVGVPASGGFVATPLRASSVPNLQSRCVPFRLGTIPRTPVYP